VGYYDGVWFSGAQQRNGYLNSSSSVINLDYPGAQKTEAHDINDFGQVVGTWFDSNSIAHEFFYSSGSYSFFDAAGAVNGTFGEGINNANVVVGYYIDTFRHAHGFVLQPTGPITTLDVPGATQTFLTGINDLGQITGYYSDASGHTHSFLYAEPPP